MSIMYGQGPHKGEGGGKKDLYGTGERTFNEPGIRVNIINYYFNIY